MSRRVSSQERMYWARRLYLCSATLYYRLTFEATMVIGWFIVAVVLYFVYNIFAGDLFHVFMSSARRA